MAEEPSNLMNALVAGYLDKVSPGLGKKFKVGICDSTVGVILIFSL